jgi:hypothetical protein
MLLVLSSMQEAEAQAAWPAFIFCASPPCVSYSTFSNGVSSASNIPDVFAAKAFRNIVYA